MALYEFYCDACRFGFEQLTSDRDPDRGKCPKCQSNQTRKLISRFAVGGQGDLRETTMHGCHEAHVSLPGQEPAHHEHSGQDHTGHDHSDHDH
ncbi:MAG: zinc ribbon domain-containing protein [Oligoflexia bacterium]|nr:zinc ribbon domain-containing protein [Oligoflexia bacterium]